VNAALIALSTVMVAVTLAGAADTLLRSGIARRRRPDGRPADVPAKAIPDTLRTD